jgi:hypothetical protein
MKYIFEMGSGGMTYILNFVEIGSDIEKLVRRLCTDIETTR